MKGLDHRSRHTRYQERLSVSIDRATVQSKYLYRKAREHGVFEMFYYIGFSTSTASSHHHGIINNIVHPPKSILIQHLDSVLSSTACLAMVSMSTIIESRHKSAPLGATLAERHVGPWNTFEA